MTVAETIRICRFEIEPRAKEEALQQAKELVAAVLNLEPSVLALHGSMEVTREQIETLGELISRRREGEPLQYILGGWSFMGLPFYTDARALIPRQDTETLCEEAIRLIRERGYASALDLCTGSGCIAISLAKLTNIRVTATDMSEAALMLAAENAALNDVSVSFRQGDLFACVRETFDLIVCNPPYLDRHDMDEMQAELKFEPREALYGGADGLDFYRRIAREYAPFLKRGGAMLLEIGATQKERVSELFSVETRVLNDYNGQPRVLVLEGDTK